jgi:hypothetical protein
MDSKTGLDSLPDEDCGESHIAPDAGPGSRHLRTARLHAVLLQEVPDPVGCILERPAALSCLYPTRSWNVRNRCFGRCECSLVMQGL